MIPYYVLMGATALVGTISLINIMWDLRAPYSLEKRDHTADVFFIIWLVLLCCRSKYCGIDLTNYEYYFNSFLGSECSISSVIRLKQRYGSTYGYVLYNLIVQIMTSNYQVFLATIAVTYVVPLWWFYKRESENQFLSIMTFITFGLFSMYFSGLRQTLAMTLVIPAYYACRDKKLMQFVGIVLLAMLTHNSGFVMAAIYPVYHMSISKKHMYVLVPLMAVAYVLKDRLFLFLLLFFGYDGSIASTGAFGILILLILFAVYAYVVVPADEEIPRVKQNATYDEVRDYIGLRNLLLLSVFIQMFAPLNALVMRMNYYFLLLVPITITKVAPRASRIYNQIAKLAVVVMSIVFLAQYLLNAGPGDVLRIYPYQAFWS